MSDSASDLRAHRNPDVLMCIANLSNDEVFTPPEFANQMLDTLEQGWAESNNGANIWEDPTVTFLDPFTKTGVFLREIVKRLNTGLEQQISDLQKRIDHILTKQVFGIAVTELTALMARRSVYCSKQANGVKSIATQFDDPDGNIWFQRTEHTWVGGGEWVLTHDTDGKEIKKYTNGKCKYCGAKQDQLDRGADLETHAYAFIHTADIQNWIEKTFGESMQFDVIIGNPPYQVEDRGHGASASPIYDKFVEQAKALDPRMLCMVIPARWYGGGKGLTSFRTGMLNDLRIRQLVDFVDANSAFPGVDISGGVCYFLWDRDNPGECTVTSQTSGGNKNSSVRALLEPGLETFIRSSTGVAILHKIANVEGCSGSAKLNQDLRFSRIVSARKPFGLPTDFKGTMSPKQGDLTVYQNGGLGYISRDKVPTGHDLIDSYSVITSYVSSDHGGNPGKSGQRKVLSTIRIIGPGEICTETYLAIGNLESEQQAVYVAEYMSTKFVRFLISLATSSHHITKSGYDLVPFQNFNRTWTDEDLYEKYGLSVEEISTIESTIRSMDVSHVR